MPIIPLYTLPAHPNASHQVLAPGGYERWQITTEDESQSLRISVEFWLGDWTDHSYRKAYDRYRRRPTRVSPPKPVDYPSVHLAISREGQPVVTRVTRYKAADVRASSERPDVTIGPNWIVLQLDGCWKITLPDVDLQINEMGKAHGTVIIADQSMVIDGSGLVEHDFGTKPPIT
jgi:hypothetical protein